jgi:type IV pilus assembly protein PilM
MRILGVDIGTTAVRAVEVESNFRRHEIREYHERFLSPGEDPYSALHQLILSLPKSPDRIVQLIPTAKTTFRNITLPTRDKKAIQSGIAFELEDDLPFELDACALEHSILGHSGNSTSLHVAALLKESLSEELEKASLQGVQVDVLCTEAWALRGLLNRILPQETQSEPSLVVYLGAARTLLLVHHQGVPQVIRELPWGGSDLTQALCRRYGLPFDEAEKTKLENGFVLPPSQYEAANAQQKEFSDTFLEPLADLLLEMRQALLSGKSVTHHSVARIYLAGGPALLSGLGKLIEEELKVPVFTLQPMTQASASGSHSAQQSGIRYAESTDSLFGLALSAALTLVGNDRAGVLNFRKGEFAKQGQTGEFQIPSLKGPALSLSLVLCMWIGSNWIKSTQYQTVLENTQTQLERSVKSFFGQMSASAVRTYLGRPSELRKNITKQLDEQKELQRLTGGNPKSPLFALQTLSGAIPKDTVVDMIQFQLGSAPTQGYDPSSDSTVSLTFIVSDANQTQTLTSLLSEKIDELQSGKPEEVPPSEDSPAKRTKITFTGKIKPSIFPANSPE